MDMTALAETVRSGRRGALAGLLAGAATLLGPRIDTEAGKRCRRCPHRTCCLCNSSSPTPGCQFGPRPADDSPFAIQAICTKVCGGIGTITAAGYTPSEVSTTVCNQTLTQCTVVGCPLY